MYFANKGSGKSTYLAMLARKALKSKKYWKVYVTEPVAGCLLFNVEDDFGTKDFSWDPETQTRRPVLLCVGEGAIDFPNTKPMPEHQKAFARLSRHYLVDMAIASQSYEDCNIVLRRLYDKMYLLNRSIFMDVTVMKRIRKTIGIDEQTHQIIEQYAFQPWYFGGMKWFYRRPWYKYFDSYFAPRLQDTEDEQLPDLERKIIDFNTLVDKAKSFGKQLDVDRVKEQYEKTGKRKLIVGFGKDKKHDKTDKWVS